MRLQFNIKSGGKNMECVYCSELIELENQNYCEIVTPVNYRYNFCLSHIDEFLTSIKKLINSEKIMWDKFNGKLRHYFDNHNGKTRNCVICKEKVSRGDIVFSLGINDTIYFHKEDCIGKYLKIVEKDIKNCKDSVIKEMI